MARLTEEKIQQIKEAYAKDPVYSHISKLLGVSPATVKKYATGEDTPAKKKKRDPDIIDFESLANKDNLIERFGKYNTMQEVQNYIKTLNDDLKKGKELPINISLNHNKRIVKDEKRAYYFGHIFPKKIFYDLIFDKICKNIQEKYKFSFNLVEILEYILYCRII